MRYLTQRVITGILVLVCVSLLAFTLVLFSGDPVRLMVSEEATASDRERLRREYGFDRPMHIQYLKYMARAIRGDFGMSLRYRVPNTELVLDRVPATLQLMAFAVTFALFTGVPLGILAGVKEGSSWDLAASFVAVVGQAAPTFFIGMALILIFAVELNWFPSGGLGGLRNTTLPGITLGAAMVAQTARMLRSSLLEVMSQDYVRTAFAKGLDRRRVIVKHALKNAAMAPLTLLGVQIGVMFGGAIITEQVFAYRGLGLLGVQAILNRDVPLVMAWVNFAAAGIVLMSLIVDACYVFVDPRVRLR